MYRQILTLAFIFLTLNCQAQISSVGVKDAAFSTFYQQRSSLFHALPQRSDQIVFLGNSITNGNEWQEMFNDARVINRGISGDVTAGVLNRLEEVIRRKPAKVFILIGINDLAAGRSPDSVANAIMMICRRLHNETRDTKVYVQSLFPVNEHFKLFPNHVSKGQQIIYLNALLNRFASAYHYTYINLYPSFCNTEGQLDTLYTNDGLHQKGPAYMLWKHLIFPYLYDLQQKPALIPFPRKLQWTGRQFLLYSCHTICLMDTLFKKEATLLHEQLNELGWNTEVTHSRPEPHEAVILFKKDSVNAPSDKREEAYRLSVNQNEITITAVTAHGAFNALQTLLQLMRDGTIIPGVEIADYPAFPWRGYMVDVGRNYQSMDLLKEQIAIAGRYKLNVFHLHLTEDIAWRLQITQFPQLTEAANMMRNSGAYYTVNEVKELIDFCRDRYITFVPEIDVPGHSAAFKRAFGVDMQSDSGLYAVKKIFREVCQTYGVPYLHIGGDEVKITDQHFLPAIISYVHGLGKQTIGWSPGGNLDTATIRELWMKEGPSDKRLRYIDSRNFYINHMDPLESVVSIFNRKVADADSGSRNILGGTLCLWPDRNVIRQEDIFTMNPVYPAMITFAERCWRGGGESGWKTTIRRDDSCFRKFEVRLVDHQKQYFSEIKFPYIAQSDIHWKLIGPYNNKGRTDTRFAPESSGFSIEKAKNYHLLTGGTIILRHFWYPAVQGALLSPKDSTTYYAAARVWCSTNYNASMWIGFYNISRSVNTSSPTMGTWDDRGSAIWINHVKIPTPEWIHAGSTGSLEKPLIDEGYEYRAPVRVFLHQGWNEVLVKLPVGSFKSSKVQSPVKWMFTAAFVSHLGVNYIADNKVLFANPQ